MFLSVFVWRESLRKIAAWVVLGGTTIALAAAGSAAAHGVGTARRHAQEDSVILGQSAQARLNHHTKMASAREARAAAVAGTPDKVGRWGPVVNWPVVAVNAALLPNGKVLAYDSVGDHAVETYPDQTFTRATVWDPVTGGQTDVRGQHRLQHLLQWARAPDERLAVPRRRR